MDYGTNPRPQRSRSTSSPLIASLASFSRKHLVPPTPGSSSRSRSQSLSRSQIDPDDMSIPSRITSADPASHTRLSGLRRTLSMHSNISSLKRTVSVSHLRSLHNKLDSHHAFHSQRLRRLKKTADTLDPSPSSLPHLQSSKLLLV